MTCFVLLRHALSTQIHHDAKHDKLPWDPALYEDVHAKHGGSTTVGVAIRGTTNAKKLKVGYVMYTGRGPWGGKENALGGSST